MEGTIVMLHGEAQAKLRREFNMNYCGRRVTKTKLQTTIAASGGQSVAFYAFKAHRNEISVK